MVTEQDVQSWRGRTVYDRDGDKIGKLEEIYLDEQSGQPEWAAVHTGLLGTKLNFVPLDGAASDGDDVRVQFDKSTVKDAPNVDRDNVLTADEEAALFRHYGLHDSDQDDRAAAGSRGHRGDDRTADQHPDASTRDDDEAIARDRDPDGDEQPSSEYERTREESERIGESRRGRLRKYSEDRQTTENVRRTESGPEEHSH